MKDKYHIQSDRRGGFNVTVRRIINPMPGATGGFKSIREALVAIKVLEKTNGDVPGNSDRFWRLLHRVNGTTQRSREVQRRIAASMGMRVIRLGPNSSKWVPENV